MNFHKTTEATSNYDNLEQKPVSELLGYMNSEDKSVPLAVEKVLPEVESLTQKVIEKLSEGGRLFYIGAGTSGRLGILDASECPPTFGVPHELVIGLIAGGDTAIRKAVEHAEDSLTQGWKDLKNHHISLEDIVIGIAASGTTPYVIEALRACQKHNITTGCVTCNKNSPLSEVADFPIEVIVGPEVITGSSRMKAGTAQKLILNMISTATMISLGRVKGNKMVDMQLSNDKLKDRAVRMIKEAIDVNDETAKQLLKQYKSVRVAINNYSNGRS